MTEAEEEIASALSLPDFPTANTQRRMIEQPMAALYAGEIKIPSEVVDEILRTGSNHARSQLRIIYNYMIDQPSEDYTDFVRREYGKGGKGLVIDGCEYSVWFDELGMQIAVGHTVEDKILDKAFLSWDDVSGRIQQLLNQGEYAPQVVLDAARGNALHEHAEALSFMEGDMAEGVSELVFDDMKLFPASYPDREERISEYLSHQENVLDLVDRLEGLAAAYEEDPSVMRFKYYAPDRMLARFQKFAKEAVPFEARDGFAWNEHEMFITQDEIDAYLSRGGAYSNSRLATYSFFLNHEDSKERTDFMKNQFGTGGSSHALSGADDSHADYGSKGLRLERGNYGAPYAKVEMTWAKVAQRIDYLIKNDKFMTAKDFAGFITVQRTENGFDYTVFNLKCRPIDCGILESPEMSIHEAMAEILRDEGLDEGITSAYYVDIEGMILIPGFFRVNPSTAMITMQTKGYVFDDRKGSWMASEEAIIDGKQFFLMESESYGWGAAYAVVDDQGRKVAEDTYNGFDDRTVQQIRIYLNAPQAVVEHIRRPDGKIKLEIYQQYYENGEYLRSVESGTEQNYNMIDGVSNNKSAKQKVEHQQEIAPVEEKAEERKTVSWSDPDDPKMRKSVLKRLRERQKEIAMRYGRKAPEQEKEVTERTRK